LEEAGDETPDGLAEIINNKRFEKNTMLNNMRKVLVERKRNKNNRNKYEYS
jgi:hypothetical protein